MVKLHVLAGLSLGFFPINRLFFSKETDKPLHNTEVHEQEIKWDPCDSGGLSRSDQ